MTQDVTFEQKNKLNDEKSSVTQSMTISMLMIS